MTIISRYLAFSFLKTWGMALMGFLVLYTAIDFLEKIGDFMGKGVGLKHIVLFFLAQLPKVVVLMVPVATLVGVLITLAIMARASEIVAFKAGGVSLFRLSAPIVAASLGVCALVFTLSDVVSPRTTAVANAIWQGLVKEQQTTSAVVQDVWLKNVRLIQHFKSYDEAAGTVQGVTLIFTDDEMYLARRLEATSGRFIEGRLVLHEAEEKVYDHPAAGGGGRSFKRYSHPTLTLDDWPAPPPGFGRVEQNSDELSVAQLWRSIDRLRAEGFNPVKQRVDLQFKFSFALLSFIMVAVGLPIGFWKEKGGSVALGLAIGLVLSFIYLIVMELARSLGYAGLLPPFAAAWLPNLLFLLLGAYMFSYVRQ
ncbi:MAG: LPS export ABC transporter permease LptG [Candidatus Adiutrix sp.]|jgi:lipopolysaccharide export system permease protein|nr:LPS export ABC transporter permease LptG [Candidatus Adiutrix sp.]